MTRRDPRKTECAVRQLAGIAIAHVGAQLARCTRHMRCLGLLVIACGCLNSTAPPKCNEAAGQSEQLVDPSSLTCETFSLDTCDDACGPCPAIAEPAPPDWGACTSNCTGLAEAACLATTGCWAALDWTKYYDNDPSYVACYAVATVTATGSCATLDADACASRDDCAGLYQTILDDCVDCGGEMFEGCIPKTQQAGTCGAAACQIAAPTCPSGTTPGVTDSCWTGSCIPDQFCGVTPG